MLARTHARAAVPEGSYLENVIELHALGHDAISIA